MAAFPHCPLLLAFIFIFFFFFFFFHPLYASPGDSDPIYKDCVVQCEKSGCAGDKCFQHCKFSSDGKPVDGPWYLQEPLYLRWKQWDCQTDCRYHCMLAREEERTNLGDKPVKYHGKWPFRRVYGIQEPVAVALATLNLAVQFHGWISFFILLYYKLPLKPNKKTYYEYTGLWHIYGVLAMNSWFWNAAFHCRDVELTEKLDYSSAVAFIGFSLIVAILRALNVRDEAAKVMVSAPIISFVTTHILYLNFYKLDYGNHQFFRPYFSNVIIILAVSIGGNFPIHFSISCRYIPMHLLWFSDFPNGLTAFVIIFSILHFLDICTSKTVNQLSEADQTIFLFCAFFTNSL